MWPEEMLLVLAHERNSSCLDFKHPVKSKGLEELPGEDKVGLCCFPCNIHPSVDGLFNFESLTAIKAEFHLL